MSDEVPFFELYGELKQDLTSRINLVKIDMDTAHRANAELIKTLFNRIDELRKEQGESGKEIERTKTLLIERTSNIERNYQNDMSAVHKRISDLNTDSSVKGATVETKLAVTIAIATAVIATLVTFFSQFMVGKLTIK